MIKLKPLICEILSERMSYEELMSISDPARKDRASRIPARSLAVKSINDKEAWKFSYKTPKNENTTGLRHQGFIYFYKDSIKPGDNAMAIDCSTDCSCFGENTKILMYNGTYKSIQDIKPGELVYTHTGNIKQVTNVMIRKVNPDESVFKMKIIGFPQEFVVTGEHPFYTLRGNDYCRCGCGKTLWVQKDDMIKNRWSPSYILRRNYLTGHHKRNVNKHLSDNSTGIFKWIPVKYLKPREWFLSPWFSKGETKIDPDFARLVGYYASEGCIPNKNGSAVRLTLNINEWDTIGTDVLKICKKLNFKCHRKKSNWGNWFDITIKNNNFKDFCKKNVGEGSHTKLFSNEILSWNDDGLKNLYIGAVLGDGWINHTKGINLFSVNFNLISQYFLILNKLRIRNGVSISNNKKEKRNTCYRISVPMGESLDTVKEWIFAYLREKDKIVVHINSTHDIGYHRCEGHLHGIRSIEKIEYSGLVYNLSIEDDESYIVHGVAVHNCKDYRYRFSYANKAEDAGENGPNSLNKGLNYPSSINRGPGLCKHLLSLKEYLKTNIEGEPPTPEEPGTTTPVAKPVKSTQPVKPVPTSPPKDKKPPEEPEELPTDKTQTPDKKTLSKKIPRGKLEDPTQTPEGPEKIEDPESPLEPTKPGEEEEPSEEAPEEIKENSFDRNKVTRALDEFCRTHPIFII